MRFLRILGGGVVEGEGDNAEAGLEGVVSERQPAEFWTESELEAHSFPLYPASKPSSRLSEAVRESAR